MGLFEFVIDKGTLQKELALIHGVAERKTTLPILANILIESQGEDKIIVTATDLDVTLRTTVDAGEILTPGKMSVPSRKLFDIARNLPDAMVRFSQQENEWVALKCGVTNYRMPGIAGDTFPDIPKTSAASMKISPHVLARAIERTEFAIVVEEGRYTLSGAKFEVEKGRLRVVTTDGHRLAFVEAPGAVTGDGKIDVLIPRKALKEVVKLTKEMADDAVVEFGHDENHIWFQCGPRLLISRQLSGQFPNYEMVMPKDNDQVFEIAGGEFLLALRRALVMADDRSRCVRFDVAPDQLVLSAQNSEEGEARETAVIKYSGDKIEIGFNAEYIRDFLQVIDNSLPVAVSMKDGNSQIEIKPIEEGSELYRYVVMPMRL